MLPVAPERGAVCGGKRSPFSELAQPLDGWRCTATLTVFELVPRTHKPNTQPNVNKYSTQLRFARAHDPVYLLGISVIALCASVLL